MTSAGNELTNIIPILLLLVLFHLIGNSPSCAKEKGVWRKLLDPGSCLFCLLFVGLFVGCVLNACMNISLVCFSLLV